MEFSMDVVSFFFFLVQCKDHGIMNVYESVATFYASYEYLQAFNCMHAYNCNCWLRISGFLTKKGTYTLLTKKKETIKRNQQMAIALMLKSIAKTNLLCVCVYVSVFFVLRSLFFHSWVVTCQCTVEKKVITQKFAKQIKLGSCSCPMSVRIQITFVVPVLRTIKSQHFSFLSRFNSKKFNSRDNCTYDIAFVSILFSMLFLIFHFIIKLSSYLQAERNQRKIDMFWLFLNEKKKELIYA